MRYDISVLVAEILSYLFLFWIFWYIWLAIIYPMLFFSLAFPLVRGVGARILLVKYM